MNSAICRLIRLLWANSSSKWAKYLLHWQRRKINVKTGNLRNSIGYIERDNRGKGRAFRLIGARVYGPYKGFHAHLIEEGTADRTPSRKKKGK